jgi:hypothetical protein
MSLFDDLFSGGQGAAAGDVGKGYANAGQYMQPFYNGGVNDWNQYNQALQNQGNTLNQYGNPMDWAWRNASLSPDQFYNNAMSGYQMSPQAKYAMNAMTNSTDHAASASGMLGSGAYGRELNQNANQISQNDMQQYFDNYMRSYQGQMGAGQNYQNQMNNYMSGLFGGANMGYNAGNQMGNYAIGQGMANAQGDEANAKDWNNAIAAGAMAFGL